MSNPATTAVAVPAHAHHSAVAETPLVRRILISVAILFLLLFLMLPLISVFFEALRNGVGTYVEALTEEDAVAAIKLTLIATLIAVPLNLVFGEIGRAHV